MKRSFLKLLITNLCIAFMPNIIMVIESRVIRNLWKMGEASDDAKTGLIVLASVITIVVLILNVTDYFYEDFIGFWR